MLATSLVAAFAALGGVGVATGAISAVQYQYGKKVTICHKGKTIAVAKQAVAAHVRKHDDAIGSCASVAAKKRAEKAKKAEAEKAKAERPEKAKAERSEHAKAESEKAGSEKSGQDRGAPGNGKGRGKGK